MDVQRDALNPYPWYREMARRGGAQYDPVGDTWGVFRYADALSVLKEPESFSNHAPETASERLSSTVILTDPPQHRGLRQALVGWFSARAAARLELRVREVAGGLVGEAAKIEEIDFIRDIAIPLPIIIMADVLGVPSSDFRKFKEWCDSASSNGAPSPDGVLRFDRPTFVASRERWGSGEAIDYFTRLARARRAEPAEDLLSALASIEVGGHRLTDEELAANCFQVLLAGNETTTNLLGNALLCLDDNPEVWDELRANPRLISPMLEEVLRYRSSVHGVVRRVTHDVQVGGVDVAADALLMVWLAAGNRDASEFADPDRFDINRSPNRHLAFGQGIHFCAGANLARTEARVVFELLVENFADLRVRRDGGGLRPLPSATLYGVTELPLALVPRG